MNDSDPRWNDESVTPSCGNVFIDLGFQPAQAQIMKLRVEVLMRITEQISKKGWTEVQAVRQLGITNQQAA